MMTVIAYSQGPGLGPRLRVMNVLEHYPNNGIYLSLESIIVLPLKLVVIKLVVWILFCCMLVEGIHRLLQGLVNVIRC